MKKPVPPRLTAKEKADRLRAAVDKANPERPNVKYGDVKVTDFNKIGGGDLSQLSDTAIKRLSETKAETAERKRIEAQAKAARKAKAKRKPEPQREPAGVVLRGRSMPPPGEPRKREFPRDLSVARVMGFSDDEIYIERQRRRLMGGGR